jgi:hypothetical protein
VADGVGTTAANTTVQIRITPSDAALGTADTTGDFTVDNIVPVSPYVSVTTPSGTESGLVTISYTLTDTESDPCTIAVEFSTDGGTNYGPATCFGGDGLSGLTSSPGGTAHTVVWNSFADGVATSASNATVRIRITATDTLPGTARATGDFTVDNTSISSGDSIGSPWPIVVNPSATNSDNLCALATDGVFIYAVGVMVNQVPSANTDWRVEKRRLDDGSLVTGFGTGGSITISPSARDEWVCDAIVHGAHLYICGEEWISAAPDNYAWRMEKRSLTDGSLDAAFGTNGVITTPGLGSANIRRMRTDSTHLYVLGVSEAGGAGSGDIQLRIEKRLLTDGSLDAAFGTNGILEDNASANLGDAALDIFLQGGNLYLGGGKNLDLATPATSNGVGTLQCRSATDGSLVASFGTNGEVVIDDTTGNDVVTAIGTDGTNLYVLLYQETNQGTDIYDCRVQKRLLSDGSLVLSQALGTQMGGFGPFGGMIVAGNFLYARRDNVGLTADKAWGVDKLALSDLSPDASFASNGFYTSDPSTGSDACYTFLLVGGVLHLGGDDNSPGSSHAWRHEALYR